VPTRALYVASLRGDSAGPIRKVPLDHIAIRLSDLICIPSQPHTVSAQ
jgi:hypothetical protein